MNHGKHTWDTEVLPVLTKTGYLRSSRVDPKPPRSARIGIVPLSNGSCYAEFSRSTCRDTRSFYAEIS
ncbi:hypothetical protein GW17_00031196 [Ensete ventricosum]|uniref:Uncharacterized protein n=1 Tax=Ensete ventricosum TaxID=4639 RepID=A0A427B7C5_ENSVE|nr:hypothetical protein B296_00014702 [Ensete ventricosum]RWW05518.1 hypothetical protein GW17_00031196 [Ensete ventricosum]RZR78303.1 hypothetical protein BHM03_00003575 [Ensete ventricosum]